MKVFPAAIGAAGFGCMVWSGVRVSPPAALDVGGERLLILGNHRGYLTPCGCSDPMIGGIFRQATLIRKLSASVPTTIIDTGDLTDFDSRQEVMKAQTLAETLKSVGVSAINLTHSEEKLGAAELQNLQDLSGSAFTNASNPFAKDIELAQYKVAGSFLIVGLGSKQTDLQATIKTIRNVEQQEAGKGLHLIAMLEDSEETAAALAHACQELDVVTFRSSSAPPRTPRKVGKTLLVSPGEHGEYLLSIGFADNSASGYASYKLTPDIQDDPAASHIYSAYLRRVDGEPSLWTSRFRMKGQPFAGAATCAKCHESDYRVWHDRFWTSNGEPSAHVKSLKTLISKGHDKDPECLPCHVTGADFTTGFHSAKADPQLAFVSCESCHGAGAAHAANPWKVPMPQKRLADWSQLCAHCHTPLNSPNFDFHTYWPRIEHGNGDKPWKSKNSQTLLSSFWNQ